MPVRIPHFPDKLPYVGAKAAARLLGVSRQTLNNWVWRGRLAATLTADDQPLYALDDLEGVKLEFVPRGRRKAGR